MYTLKIVNSEERFETLTAVGEKVSIYRRGNPVFEEQFDNEHKLNFSAMVTFESDRGGVTNHFIAPSEDAYIVNDRGQTVASIRSTR